MIVFEKVTYKNLLSVGKQPIEIDLQKNNLTLIVGMNGAGKSQNIDAIFFALYGKPFRKIKKEQMVNSVNRKALLVELEFSSGNTQYKVVRGITPVKFEIWVNGKLKDQNGASKDYQNYLENNILKMSEKTFRQIIVLGSTSYVPFMRLTAADRRKVVEDLLDIGLFSTMNGVVKTRVSTLTDSHRDATTRLNVLNTTMTLKEKHAEETRLRASGEVSRKESAKANLIRQVDEAVKILRVLTTDREVLTARITDQSQVAATHKQLSEYGATFQRGIRKYEKEKDFFNANSKCPTCFQQISEDFKDVGKTHADKEIGKLQEGLGQLENETKKTITRLEEIEKVLVKLQVNSRRSMECQSGIQSDNKMIASLDEDIKRFNSIETSENDEEMKLLKIEIDTIKSQLSELNTQGRHYSILVEMMKDGGIKTKIVKSYLPLINRLIKKYLGILDFAIDFRFDQEFNEQIKSRNRDIYSYANFSEGEKLRIDLCLLFTWREIARNKNSASCNLLWFDEIGDSSLDSNGFDSFLKIINQSQEDQNIFIISHKGDILADKFDNILTFQKRGLFTEMKKGT